MVPAVDVNWLSYVAHESFSEVERDYWRYHGIVVDDGGQPANVPANVVDDIVDVFRQEVLQEREGGSSFTTDDRSVISTALARLSKTIPTSGSNFANPINRLIDELQASQEASKKTDEDVEQRED